MREGLKGVDVRLADSVAEVHRATLVRVVPAASQELPSEALGSEGGGRVAVDPRDQQGRSAIQKVFELELELPSSVRFSRTGGRVYVRFDHGYKPLVSQWYRSLRQLFLSRLDV